MSGLTKNNQAIAKTIKLFIGGDFPRTESGRSFPVYFSKTKDVYANLCLSSRKDLRNALTAANSAQPSWAGKTASNRGQILYRMAEMMEGRKDEFIDLQVEALGLTRALASTETEKAISLFVHYAGWSDKFQQVIGSVNPVAGPHHNFTTPEPTGVIGVLFDESAHLSELVEEMASMIVSGNAIVVLMAGKTGVLLSSLAEVFATSDLPKGVINLLSGSMDELKSQFGTHMEIQGLSLNFEIPKKPKGAKAASASSSAVSLAQEIELAGVENMKRIHRRDPKLNSLQKILRFVEYKTIWHPIGV